MIEHYLCMYFTNTDENPGDQLKGECPHLAKDQQYIFTAIKDMFYAHGARRVMESLVEMTLTNPDNVDWNTMHKCAPHPLAKDKVFWVVGLKDKESK